MSVGTTVFAFQVSLTTGGTAQRVDIPTAGPGGQRSSTLKVYVKASSANTGILYIGGSSTVTASGATGGYELNKGDSVMLDIAGVGSLWFNGPTTGDKLSVLGIGP